MKEDEKTLTEILKGEDVPEQSSVLDGDIVSRLRGAIDTHIIVPKGKYFIEQDIIVKEDGILEIDPGAQFYFGPNAGIISYGTFLPIGKKGNMIRFTASGDSWKNIILTGRLSSDSILEYCSITRGSGRRWHTSDTPYGGGLLIEGSDPRISYCKLENNEADYGGGAYIRDSAASLNDNTIIKNIADAEGGGLRLYNSDSILEKNTISHNIAYRGAGIEMYISNPLLLKNKIHHNTAESRGGGLYLSRSNPTLDVIQIEDENTIEDNLPDDICEDGISIS